MSSDAFCTGVVANYHALWVQAQGAEGLLLFSPYSPVPRAVPDREQIPVSICEQTYEWMNE